ncbi:MAG: TnsA-like heteromeric transposase endonuclease subunit [Sporichthyaceae bacterium]|nr:TnsA-like heteromeric transposase endonuclease subunit [Sporichthyaceae bacterium]
MVGIAAQPFWLHWHDGHRGRRHAPDFFARRADGTGVVLDVRADDRIQPDDAEAFDVTADVTARACAQAGWVFRRVGVPDSVLVANVRWLARYRHARCGARSSLAERLLEAFAQPTPLVAGACEVGDGLAVLPVVFHLLWRQVLLADLTVGPLHSQTTVRVADSDGGAGR